VKYWEIIADNLSKAGWSWGCVSAVDSQGRTIFVADAHRGWSRKNKARQTAAMMVKLPRLRHPTFQLIFGTAE
jgi:hypothetical protein